MPELIKIPNLIIIGGSSRNVGKTTLAVNLIKKYAAFLNVTGLKVTSLRPGEEACHGSHDFPDKGSFRITEETNQESTKDTALMLKAGARNVWYIESPDHLLDKAMTTFMETCYTGGPIVCESRSLRRSVVPGLFVMLKHCNPALIKSDSMHYELLADIVFRIDPLTRNSGSLAERIAWYPEGWRIKPAQTSETAPFH